MKRLSQRPKKKRILIVNCYVDELRLPIKRKTKIPQSMATAFLAGMFSSELCDIRLYDELHSGPLENERLLAFPDMLVLTGLNAAFDRMLHITAYARTKNQDVIVVAGGPAIRALPEYSKNFFDYVCTGDVEQLRQVIEDTFGDEYLSETFLAHGWAIPRFDLAYWMTIMTYVESSRNCYFRCSYCSLTAEKGKYQPYEIDYVRHQFLALGQRQMVHFLDNNFASLDKKFLLNRFDLLKQLWGAGYFKRWGAEVTSDFFLNSENLELARSSGCLALFCGVESFDKGSLLNFKKYQNTCLPQVQMIRKCLDAGITFLYGIVQDLTTRTIAELKEELDFIIENPDITLPAFVTLAIPLLGTPFFHECLDHRLFLPNLKLRDLDGSTITLKPLDSMTEAVHFVREIQTLRGYKLRIIRHMRDFYRRYRKILSWEKMGFAQYCALHLCAQKLATTKPDIDTFLGNGFKKRARTFVGSTEPLDSFYQPAFPIDSRYQHYFKPTMLTDQEGELSRVLQPDLLKDQRLPHQANLGTRTVFTAPQHVG
jgi:radical SAM superfamily enzyme YgiQ (UPF0313 family)